MEDKPKRRPHGAAFLCFVLAGVSSYRMFTERRGAAGVRKAPKTTSTKNNLSKFDKVHASMMCAAEVPLAGI